MLRLYSHYSDPWKNCKGTSPRAEEWLLGPSGSANICHADRCDGIEMEEKRCEAR